MHEHAVWVAVLPGIRVAKVAGNVKELQPVRGDPHDIAVTSRTPDAVNRGRGAATNHDRTVFGRTILGRRRDHRR